MNVLPIGVTADATNGEQPTSDVESNIATLNGVAGPGVSNGYPTQYFFEYGTSTAYGSKSPTGTVGSCPPGVLPGSPYCSVPPAEYVGFTIPNLAPCTAFHFRIDASNLDGTTLGSDRSFKTEFEPPFKYVRTPKRVKHRHRFRVRVDLVTFANVTIKLRFHGKTVKTYKEGVRHGKFSQRIRAPKKKGKYTIKVTAREICGSQTKTRTIKVT